MMILSCSTIIHSAFGYRSVYRNLARSVVNVIFSIALSCLILLPAHASNILLLGDSLSASYGMQAREGWVALVQKELQSRNSDFKILNFSISGETTAGGRARLSRLLAKNDIDILWIELGGNDGLRGYPIRTIRNNLLQMIKLANEKEIEVILTQIEVPPNLGKRYLKMFKEIYPQIADKTGSKLMPFILKDVVRNKALMQKDGIHPNRKAQPIIANFVVNYLTDYSPND